MTISPMDLVADWHAKFGIALTSVPTFDPDVCKLRIALLEEELAEYEMSVALNDRVEMLDALCDLQYVLSGAVLHLGLRTQYDSLTSDLNIRADMMRGLVSQLALILEQKHYAFTAAISFRSIQKCLIAMIVRDGFDDVFLPAFLAVHENNSAKAWSHNEMEEVGSVVYEFSTCAWKPGYFIARDSRGKIIKPPGHTNVDLTGFVK